MIEEAVLQRTLQTALRHGGDFAEVFAEDRRSSIGPPRRRQGRGARRRAASAAPASGSCAARPPASPTPPTCQRGRAARRPPRPPRPRPRGAEGGTRVVALERARDARPAHEVADAAGDGGQGPQGRAARPGRRTPPASAGDSIRQVSAVVRRQPAPHPRRQLRRPARRATTRCAPGSRCSASPSATPACRPATRRPAARIGFELFDEIDAEERRRAPRPSAALTKLGARPAPTRQAARSCCGAARGGVLFHEACGHGLEADLVDKDASVFRGPRRRAGRVAARHAGRRRHLRPRVGHATRSTTRARPRSATCSSRTACSPTTCGTSLRARKEGRASSGNGRRESYQHLPMVRMTNTFLLDGADDPDDIVRGTEHGVYCVAARRRPGRTPPPATSCSA